MSLSGKVNDVIDLEFSQQKENELIVIYVALDESVLFGSESFFVYVQVTAAGVQSVNVKDEIEGEFSEMVIHEVATNESTATGNQDSLPHNWYDLEILSLSQQLDGLYSL